MDLTMIVMVVVVTLAVVLFLFLPLVTLLNWCARCGMIAIR